MEKGKWKTNRGMVKGGFETMTTEIVNEIVKREDKGKVIALERRIFRIVGKDVFYVESQSVEGLVYYIMFNTEKEFEWCSCLDHSVRGRKCKHLFAIEYAIRKGTVQDTDSLPIGINKDNRQRELQYENDEYDF
jgi:predicted nucleic acid-binding Zn finger protein